MANGKTKTIIIVAAAVAVVVVVVVVAVKTGTLKKIQAYLTKLKPAPAAPEITPAGNAL